MSLRGDRLAADLSQLRMIGTVDLPMLSYVYDELSTAVGEANDSAAFAQPASVGNSQVGAEWTALRDRFQAILANTGTALSKAGATILHIASAYEATDTEAARKLNKIWELGPPGQEFITGERLPPGPGMSTTHP